MNIIMMTAQYFFTHNPLRAARLLFAITLLLIAAWANANQLTASVDRDTIGIHETLTLIVTADAQTQQSPDFSALKNDFDILGTSRSQSIRIINGNTESSTDWHITLAPKHAGKLLIPSFALDNAISDAIEVEVTQQSQTVSTGDKDPVQVTIEIPKQEAYVQEQILVKIKLITQVNLSQAELQPLELPNAIVVNLKQQQYQTSANGKPQLIVETTYAIYPQASGQLTIPALTYTVAVDNMRSFFDDPFGRRGSNIMRLRTDEQKITVKPAPTPNNWQPASHLTLNEGWSDNTDHLKVGEPVTRTITIMADGLTGGQIAPLPSTTIDGLTFYPDQPQTKDNKTSKGVQGIRTETTAIIPNHGGSFTLPAISVQWWNTDTQTMETATLPAKTLYAEGSPNATATTTQVADNSSTTKTPEANPSPSTVNTSVPLWLWISSAAFALIALILTIYVLKLRRALKDISNSHDELEQQVSETERDIWKALKQSASNRDAAALRSAVINWAHFHWPEARIHSLEDIARLGENIELTQSLKQLDEQLYSPHPSNDWQPNQLLQLLNNFRKEKKARKNAEGLKPLYKN